MRILVSNDDGYASAGLAALVSALSTLAEVCVVAPDRDRSGVSNSLTLDRPLQFARADNGFYVVNGTPTDCVHLALTGALDFKPDLVCSGINDGANLGDDTIYSGTVAAAMEGMQLGVPAIAFSMVKKGFEDLDAVAQQASAIVEMFAPRMKNHHPMLLNVNFPGAADRRLSEWEITRLGKRHSAHAAVRQQSPRGQIMYWIGPAGSSRDAIAGTDFNAVEAGRVSITPLSVDLTAQSQRGTLSDWLASGSAAVHSKGHNDA
jgi:5'-nucleotidase